MSALAALGLCGLVPAAATAAPVCSGNCNIDGVINVGSFNAGDGSLSLSGGDRVSTGASSFIGSLGRNNGIVNVSGAATRIAVGGATGSIFFVGADGGTGVVNIAGGAQVTVDAFNAGTGFGDARLFLGSGGNGTLNVSGGGGLTVRDQGNFGVEDGLQIGRSTAAGAGTGTMTVAGPGSAVQVLGNYGFANIGQANTTFSGTEPGIGRVEVRDGGRMQIDGGTSTAYLLVGRGDRSDGNLRIAGAGARVDLTGVAAQVQVGTVAGATSFAGDGRGRVEVTDGGVLSLAGSGFDRLYVGLGLGQGEVLVGAGGRVQVAGEIRVSYNAGDLSSQTGRLTVNDSGVVQASRVVVGNGTDPRTNGTLAGTGTIDADVVVREGGAIEPGTSPGLLTIDGHLLMLGGVLRIEVAGLGSGQFDQLVVLGDADLSGAAIEFDFLDGFVPLAGETFDFLRADRIVGLDQAELRYAGLAPGFRFDIAADGGGLRFTALNDAAAVPSPGPLPLLMLALPLLHRSTRRVRCLA